MDQTSVPLGAVFGAGRSGTTWLGAVIGSHPDVVYRFEPFRRLRKEVPAVAEALRLIGDDRFGPDDLRVIYDALLPATPRTAKPPFFAKNGATAGPARLGLLWASSARSDWARRRFEKAATPQPGAPLVFKEVGFVPELLRFLERTPMPVVYLVRHPCAVVASNLRGQSANLMPSARRASAERLVRERAPELGPVFGDSLERLAAHELEALLWRIDVDLAVRAVQANARGMVVVYENLVEEPVAEVGRVLAHLGLEPSPAIERFIEASRGGASRWQRLAHGEIGTHPYFSVFRDPRSSRDSWRRQLDETQQKEIFAVVDGSPAVALAAAGGSW